jgi:heavy metal sensor kinase
VLRRPISISLRLTIWFGAVLLSGWLLFGAAMWFSLKHSLTAERHQTLDRRIDRLEELLARDTRLNDADRYEDFRDFASATGNGLMEIFHPSGSQYWRAPSVAADSFPWPPVKDLNHATFLHVVSNGQPYWVVQRPSRIGSQAVVLAAAAPEAGNLMLLHRFWNALIVSAPVLLLTAMAGGYWISRRALSPVDRITAAARSIGIRNLSERLPVTHSSDELQRLAETCNAMLERLEIAVRRLKQFTGDASHELRGPLSLTRTIAEVAMRQPDTDRESRASFLEIANASANAARLLEQMLELARADAEPLDIALEPVDLAFIVADTCSMARKLAQKRGITVNLATGAPETMTVLGHAASLRRMLWIVLDNAIKYTPESGSVDVSLRNGKGVAIVEVADTGIGISDADLPHIFDRFYRADPSRSEVEGSGLGLAIAKWIADLHHAKIDVCSHQGIGSSFTLSFHI